MPPKYRPMTGGRGWGVLLAVGLGGAGSRRRRAWREGTVAVRPWLLIAGARRGRRVSAAGPPGLPSGRQSLGQPPAREEVCPGAGREDDDDDEDVRRRAEWVAGLAGKCRIAAYAVGGHDDDRLAAGLRPRHHPGAGLPQ